MNELSSDTSFIVAEKVGEIENKNNSSLSENNVENNTEKLELDNDVIIIDDVKNMNAKTENSFNMQNISAKGEENSFLDIQNGNIKLDAALQNSVNNENVNETESSLNDNDVTSNTDELLIMDYEYDKSPVSQIFQFKDLPVQITGAWKEFESTEENYTRGCKWSPDGSCMLTCSNDNILRIFNYPAELWDSNFSWENIKEMEAVLKFSEGECVFDYCWYPLMSSYDPTSCCFAAVSRGSSVHLWDAFTGSLRCSYRPYNHLDEIATPHSLAFDLDGQKLYCGFEKMIRIFDISQPGRECGSQSTYSKRDGGIRGIISCFAFNPVDRNMYAAGTYNKVIGIYSDHHLELTFNGHHGGLTHLCFSPDGTKLYSGARRDTEILCWDLRNSSNILCSLQRVCWTNQRMYFDISKCGRFLVSGNNNGVVSIWDLTSSPKTVPKFQLPVLEPIKFFQAHKDCVNGISLHPTMPVLATSSGQRLFPEPVDSDDDDEADEIFSYKSVKPDNSLRLWWDAESDSFLH